MTVQRDLYCVTSCCFFCCLDVPFVNKRQHVYEFVAFPWQELLLHELARDCDEERMHMM